MKSLGIIGSKSDFCVRMVTDIDGDQSDRGAMCFRWTTSTIDLRSMFLML